MIIKAHVLTTRQFLKKLNVDIIKIPYIFFSVPRRNHYSAFIIPMHFIIEFQQFFHALWIEVLCQIFSQTLRPAFSFSVFFEEKKKINFEFGFFFFNVLCFL